VEQQFEPRPSRRGRQPISTSHQPGTPAKITELTRRARLGEDLFVAGDAVDEEGIGIRVEQLANSSHERLGAVAERADVVLGQTDFGKRLGDLLESRGIGVNQLALRSGLSPSTISRLIGGKRRPTAETLLALSDALKLSIDTLVGRRPPET
jgi:DNA-binding Xre family transcriptional regulator